MGFEAFASCNTGSSVLHYGAQNMRVKRRAVGGVEGQNRVVRGKANRACFTGLFAHDREL